MRKLGIALLLIITAEISSGQAIIPLYEGQKPAGSELLTSPEKTQRNPAGELVMVSSVSMPTLTVYKPETGTANGTAVIICPGGAFRFLSFAGEGNEVAKWMVSKGITGRCASHVSGAGN